MTIEEKYGIEYIKGQRCYRFDLNTELPLLEETVPFYFQYEDIEIYEGSWGQMAISILYALDEKNTKSEEELLSLKYTWSKSDVFSKEKKTNFKPFKNLFLNTNHTSTHSMMSIQLLLQTYGVDFDICKFFIRKHPIVEPKEVREYFKIKNINEFRKFLKFNQLSDNSIDKVLHNISLIDRLLLSKISKGYDSFLLFDDNYYFISYKGKAVQLAYKLCADNIDTIKRTLNYLEDFYKNRSFYENFDIDSITTDIQDILKSEIEKLFNMLDTQTLVISKIYATLRLKNKITVDIQDSHQLFLVLKARFRKVYYFKEPFISKNKNSELSNEELIFSFAYSRDEFTTKNINEYVDKMHLKRLDNYFDFFIDCGDDYVHVENDKMVKKEFVMIDDTDLQKIKKEIDFYINTYGSLQSSTFCGYAMLPKLNYNWNKYLLKGIIRTFFNDVYHIEYDNKNIKNLEYKVSL